MTQLIPHEAYNPTKPIKPRNKVQYNNNNKPDNKARQREEETSRLVLRLVTQTPAFTRHLGHTAPSSFVKPPQARILERIDPKFHEIELGDWESKINWEGVRDDEDDDDDNDESNNKSAVVRTTDALALLKRPRNPYLDNLKFDSTTVSWDGDTEDLLERARRAPLILELGVAGQSVAKHVYQNTVLSAQRPMPALKSDAYQLRREKEWSAQPITSTAEVSKGSLHADKDKMEAIIEARQRKRAEMAKDKTNRVTQAMGTLALGGGRGRTITSSLMGPGGTERTGRPSRQVGSSAAHDAEYIEQLDMVNSHTLVRDLSKVMLREFHRPKLPMSVVRLDLAWQFQIRYTPSNKKSETPSAGTSYQSIMMGAHAGAISKAKLRTEADLTPAEGKLVLLEYCEERPPVQMSKGMASKIVNYYRGDKARCPVSAGGGDRPARRKRNDAVDAKDSVGRSERPPRLETAKGTSIMDWIGDIPKKSQRERVEKEAIDILPEGITEILHPKGNWSNRCTRR